MLTIELNLFCYLIHNFLVLKMLIKLDPIGLILNILIR